MDENRTGSGARERLHVALLIDESGSMDALAPAVVAGVNEFIAELKADPGNGETEVLVTLGMFDGYGEEPALRERFAALPLSDVRQLGPSDYRPRGATPLNDAVVETIGALGERAGSEDRAMVVILTDGLENASETTSRTVRRTIAAREADGWQFVYLGANHDTWAEGGRIGLGDRGKHFAWEASGEGVDSALKVSSERVRRFRDAPAEYVEELSTLSERIAPGSSKARRLSPAERRQAPGGSGRRGD